MTIQKWRWKTQCALLLIGFGQPINVHTYNVIHHTSIPDYQMREFILSNRN